MADNSKTTLVIAGVSLVLTNCAAATDPIEALNASLDQLPKPSFELPKNTKPPKGPLSAIYARIARGALTCWLGAHGELQPTHKFRGEAKPDREGGSSKIIIYEKPPQTEPRKLGRQAFRIFIANEAGAPAVSAQNVRLAEPLAKRMAADTHRWAAGETGCIAGGLTTGWTPATKQKKKSKNTRN